jgi:hypothetical protein
MKDNPEEDLKEAVEQLEHAIEALEQEDLQLSEMEARLSIRNALMKINPIKADLDTAIQDRLDDTDLDLNL